MPKYLFYALLDMPNKLDTTDKKAMWNSLFRDMKDECVVDTELIPVIEMDLEDLETVGGMQ